jgi:tripartite-type tricarboxylate transporter receptor subunit TctC
LLAPARTSAAVIERLALEARNAMRTDEARTALKNQGFDVVGGSPTEFRRLQRAEIEKWGAVIRATGATPD